MGHVATTGGIIAQNIRNLMVAKVALEAIRGELTWAELAAKHGIHPTMIATWKRQAIEGMAATFSGTAEASKAAGEADIEKLHAKIGQLGTPNSRP